MAYYRQTLLTTCWSVLICSIIAQSAELPSNDKPIPASTSFECKADFLHVNGDSGTLSIRRTISSCGFLGQDATTFFGIDTTDLKMTAEEYILINPDSDENKITNLTGPFPPGYLLIGIKEPRIRFFFKTIDNSSTEINFIQNTKVVPFNCDTKADQHMTLVGLDKFTATFKKSIADPVHIQFVKLQNTFNHHLMTKNELEVPIEFTKGENALRKLDVKYKPGLMECSKYYEDKVEASYELSTEFASHDAYSCINIFKTNILGPMAHFDVDFSNFIKLSNSDDELIIDDGENLLKLAMLGSSNYAKKLISFSGKELAVIYNSPGPIKPTNVPFKLTVRSKELGGLLTTSDSLQVPANGSALYTLQPAAGKAALIQLDKLSGLLLKLSDDAGREITIDERSTAPPNITFGLADAKMYVEIISTKVKPSGSIRFNSVNPNCGGVFPSSLGSISVSELTGLDQNCYWLLGAQNNLLSIKNVNLIPNGCLSIYSLNQAKPIYDRCNVSQNNYLPDFSLGMAYIKVKASSKQTFDATVSPMTSASFIDVTEGLQRVLRSNGYPTAYVWSSRPDLITVNSVNKSKILSVADLDIRNGESLSIDNKNISDGDIDISNKITNITLKRSMATNDFALHRGYKIVINEYQKILVADMSKDTVTTPKNLTSVLVKVPGAKLARISYNITFSVPQKNYQMSVIDSRSLLGRQVYPEEQIHGSTTSDTLLVSIFATGNTPIPELAIQYHQLACNTTTDHVCDNSSRCVPEDKLCKGKVYCKDESDLKVVCSSGPMPSPQIIEKGVAGVTVFILFTIGLILGIIGALYGPDFYKSLEGRVRSGQYSTFSSTE